MALYVSIDSTRIPLQAFDALQECLQKFPGDQAAKTLLDYMHSAKSSEDAGRPVAPTDWTGSRKLTIK